MPSLSLDPIMSGTAATKPRWSKERGCSVKNLSPFPGSSTQGTNGKNRKSCLSCNTEQQVTEVINTLSIIVGINFFILNLLSSNSPMDHTKENHWYFDILPFLVHKHVLKQLAYLSFDESLKNFGVYEDINTFVNKQSPAVEVNIRLGYNLQ